MKKIIFTLALVVIASTAFAAQEIAVIYDSLGLIVAHPRVDRSVSPDGSTMYERVQQILTDTPSYKVLYVPTFSGTPRNRRVDVGDPDPANHFVRDWTTAENAARDTRESNLSARPGSAKSALSGYAAIIKQAQNYSNVLTWVQNNFPTLTAPEHKDLARIVHMLALSIRAAHSKDDTFFNTGE